MTVKQTVRKPFPPGNGGVSLPGPGPGRKKGVPNKFTTLKQSFLNVFERMGGDDALLEFAKTHKAVFYQMVTRLFPQEVAHSGEIKTNDPLVVKVVFVKDEGKPGNGNGNGNGGNGHKAA